MKIAGMTLELFPLDNDALEQLRAQLRAQVKDIGAPSEAADQVTDMALHMTQEALRKMESVADTIADHRVMVAACSIAFGLVRTRCEQMEAGTVAFAEAEGLRHRKFDAVVQGKAEGSA